VRDRRIGNLAVHDPLQELEAADSGRELRIDQARLRRTGAQSFHLRHP
jgi:hypothetical protein